MREMNDQEIADTVAAWANPERHESAYERAVRQKQEGMKTPAAREVTISLIVVAVLIGVYVWFSLR